MLFFANLLVVGLEAAAVRVVAEAPAAAAAVTKHLPFLFSNVSFMFVSTLM